MSTSNLPGTAYGVMVDLKTCERIAIPSFYFECVYSRVIKGEKHPLYICRLMKYILYTRTSPQFYMMKEPKIFGKYYVRCQAPRTVQCRELGCI